MRPIGFSTGALAYSDFRRGLLMSLHKPVQAVELSALRQNELIPLLDALDTLDLSGFRHVALHAPSQFDPEWEPELCRRLRQEIGRGWPIVVHPDALHNLSLWKEFGTAISIENMDKRKPVGRTARELDGIFRDLPEAKLCFDIGHARQCDPTMTEAFLILRDFGSRLSQVHVSEVATSSKHNRLSYLSIIAFQKVAHLIPPDVPLILETPVDEGEMQTEIAMAQEALPVGAVMVA